MRIKLRILWGWALALLIAGMPLQQAVYAADSTDVIQSLSRIDSTGSAAASPFISNGIDTTSTEVIQVIVQLSRQSASVGRYASKMGVMQLAAESTESAILKEQSSFITAVKTQGISMKVNRQFSTVLNGMEVTLPANQVPALAKIPGVKSIHKNRTFYPIPEANTATVTSNVYPPYIDLRPLQLMGLEQVWNMGYTGEGLKVGVLDTGVDYMHPDLAGAYKGGYNSINNTTDPYEDAPVVDANFKGSYHGTHVTGTIVGRAANTGSDLVQKGVAYNADLYVYKVLGFDGRGTTGTSAQVIDGIERAVKDGMDVLNLSLGSDSEKDPNTPESIAINNAVMSGVVVVVANGNAATSGPYYYSMGSPASSQLAISVGAATTSGNRYTGSVNVSGATYDMQLMGWRTGQEDFRNILGTDSIEGVYLGLGLEADYTGKDVTGKIAFVSRGKDTFVDKIKRAKEHGAKAIVIFNGNAILDEFGDPTTTPDLSSSVTGPEGDDGDGSIGTFLGDSLDMIPAFDMSGKEGRALAASGTPLQFTFGVDYPKTVVPGDEIVSFSSRGPNSDGSLGIKPDLAAPGVDILSTWPAFGKVNPGASYSQAYNRISGTSMATPHVTGAALLLKQQHPNWTPFDIRAALANTAVPLLDASGTRYDVYSQGAGRINVLDAVYTPAILQTVDTLSILDKTLTAHDVTNYGANASFGVMAAGSSPKTKSLQLKNSSGQAVKYAAKVVMNPSVTSDPNHPIATPNVGDITVSLQGLDIDKSITVDANSTKPLSLTVAPNANAAKGVYEGQVVLESNGLPSLHLPFVLHVGTNNPDNGFGLQDVTMTKTVISPNGDKINDSSDISFTLSASDVNYVEINIFGLDEFYIGTLGRLRKIDGSLFTPGVYTFKGIDGSYVDSEVDANGTEIIKHLTTPGVYKLSIFAAQLGPDGFPVVDDYGNSITYSITKTFGLFTVNDVPAPSPIGGGGGAPLPPSEPTTYDDSILSVVEQGQLLALVTPTFTSKENTLIITIPDAELDKSIKSAAGSPVAVIVDAASQAGSQPQTKVILTSPQISTLTKAATGSAIVINTGNGSVAVPASLLNSVPAGASVEIAVSKAADQASVISGQMSGSSIIGTPVSYEVRIVEGDKSITPIQTTGKSYVKRSFTIEGTVDANKTGVLYMENGKVFPVPSTFTTKNGVTTVTVSRPGFSVYAAATRQVKFEDIDSSWAKTQIETLAGKFLLNGTSDNQFSPKETVTRAQFSAMLVRALGLQAINPAPFKDVNANDWFASDVAAAYEAGLVNGVDAENFVPQATISRQDLTVMLARAVDLLRIPKKSGSTRVPYADTTGFAPYAADSIQKVSDIGLMSGVELNGSTYFLPTDPTTREAAAMVLYSLLQNGKLIN